MSVSLTEANFGKTLHFETYVGTLYKHLRFEALLDAKTAMQLGVDAPAEHQRYIAAMPPGIPNDYRAYKYALFYDVENKPVYLGVPWIKAESITENENDPYLFTVWGIDAAQAASIRSMMIAHGIESFTVTRPS